MDVGNLYENDRWQVTDVTELGLSERVGTILNEGKIETSYGKEYLVVMVQLAVNKKIKELRVPRRSGNKLVESFGSDSKEWAGKQIRLVPSVYKDREYLEAEPITLNSGDSKK